MADLLTDQVLPVLGLCPPAGLLLPWLVGARSASGRPLGLPDPEGGRPCAATFAVARRIADRSRAAKEGQAPVAAVLLQEADPDAANPEPACLLMLDWAGELGPWSARALQAADPRAIFGIDVPIERRLLLAVTEDDAQPLGLLRNLGQRISMSPEDLGWLGLRGLYEVLGEYLRRIPRERYRAPERTAGELMVRLAQLGIRPWHTLMAPPQGLFVQARRAAARWRGYEAFRPGSLSFPWSFAPREAVVSEALVLEAQNAARRAAARKARSQQKQPDSPADIQREPPADAQKEPPRVAPSGAPRDPAAPQQPMPELHKTRTPRPLVSGSALPTKPPLPAPVPPPSLSGGGPPAAEPLVLIIDEE